MGTSCRLASALLTAITCAAIAGCGDSPKPAADVSGDIVLATGFAYQEDNGALIRPNQLATDANPFELGCTGIGGFADITKGATVSLLDASGKAIATGTVTGDIPTAGPASTVRCTLAFRIEKAPAEVAGAQVRVGQHPAVALAPDYAQGYATINIVQ